MRCACALSRNSRLIREVTGPAWWSSESGPAPPARCIGDQQERKNYVLQSRNSHGRPPSARAVRASDIPTTTGHKKPKGHSHFQLADIIYIPLTCRIHVGLPTSLKSYPPTSPRLDSPELSTEMRFALSILPMMLFAMGCLGAPAPKVRNSIGKAQT